VLLTRAAEQFPDLTDAEKKLLHAITVGEVADYSSPNDAENDPQQAHTWDASRTIRAKVIRWLCVDPEATRHIHLHGIHIYAATIEGWLDLMFVTISVPFALRRCVLKAGVTLVYADTRTLSFSGSVLGTSGGTPLDALGAHVRGELFLGNGFRAEGEVSLLRVSTMTEKGPLSMLEKSPLLVTTPASVQVFSASQPSVFHVVDAMRPCC
jgi:hypothetical protein